MGISESHAQDLVDKHFRIHEGRPVPFSCPFGDWRSGMEGGDVPAIRRRSIEHMVEKHGEKEVE